MKTFLGWVKRKTSIIFTYVTLISLVSVIYGYKQMTLIPGANSYERQIVAKVDAYQYPWRDPVDAPYVTAVWATSRIAGIDTLRTARLVSAAASVLAIVMLFQLLRNWLLSPGKALIGTSLYAVSSWNLALGRGAHATVAGVCLLLLTFNLGTRLLFTTRPFIDWLLLVSSVVLALYTPVAPWLIFIAGTVSLLHYRQRQRSLPLKHWQKVVVILIGVLLALPMVIGLILSPSKGLTLLGMENIVTSIPDLVLNIYDAVRAIFFVNIPGTPLGLGRLPMLDILSVFMFLLGGYYFERRLSLKRSKMLMGGLFIGIIVSSLGGFDIMKLSMLLPLIYIFISAGVHEAITRWLSVFPRNPIARGTGVIVLSIAIGFVSVYHLSKVFIARPGNPEIRQLYSAK